LLESVAFFHGMGKFTASNLEANGAMRSSGRVVDGVGVAGRVRDRPY